MGLPWSNINYIIIIKGLYFNKKKEKNNKGAANSLLGDVLIPVLMDRNEVYFHPSKC